MQFSIHLQVSNCFWLSRLVFWVVSYHCFLLIVIFLQLLSLSSFWYYHQLSLGNPALPRFLQLHLFLNKNSIENEPISQENIKIEMECWREWGLPGRCFGIYSASTYSWLASQKTLRYMQQEKQERAKVEQFNTKRLIPKAFAQLDLCQKADYLIFTKYFYF